MIGILKMLVNKMQFDACAVLLLLFCITTGAYGTHHKYTHINSREDVQSLVSMKLINLYLFYLLMCCAKASHDNLAYCSTFGGIKYSSWQYCGRYMISK